MLIKLMARGAAKPLQPPATTVARRQTARRRQAAPAAAAAAAQPAYVPWEESKENRGDQLLALDCTHSSALTVTHHKGGRNPPLPGLASDCSTGLALDVLAAAAADAAAAAAAAPWLSRPALSANHFDADAVLSIWVLLNREAAQAHSAVLRHAARIGDMREAALEGAPLAAQARGWDGIEAGDDAAVHHSLKLCCWMNSIERRQFSPPYVDKDAAAKHRYFLERLGEALTPEGIEALRPDWQEEYDQVLAGWRALQAGLPASVRRHDALGLVALSPPRPLHYYSAFSWAIGADVVLTALPGRSYEVESRYTQFVCTHSRPVQARLDMHPLAEALNRVDTGREAGCDWAASSMVDTGPILRLDRGGSKLGKAQRYGHPTDRPHFSSGLTPAQFEAAVVSFYTHGLAGTTPKVGGWSWEELHDLNASRDWGAWERAALPAALAAAAAAPAE